MAERARAQFVSWRNRKGSSPTSKATAENCLFMCFVLKICIGVYWAMLRAVPAAGLNCTAQANQITTAAVTSKHNRASFSSDDRLGVAAKRVE
jgi:hypothetical protein